jgi:hypothetical protein
MTAGFYHQSLASGRWFTFSLVEQLANIGSEVHRVIRAGNDKSRFDNAVARALELFDLTLSDSRWRGRFKEVARVRELFCYAALGNPEYHTSLQDLDKYFHFFALAAQAERHAK